MEITLSYIETEIKVLDICLKNIQRIFEQMGAEKVFGGHRHIILFDFEDFRLRKNQEEIKLTDEGKLKLSYAKSNPTARENIKVFVSRKEEIQDFLGRIGLSPITSCSSYRDSYEWRGIDFDVDRFPHIPPFIEIDLVGSNIALEEILKLLEISDKEITTLSTPEIYEKYNLDYYEIFKVTI